MIVRKYKTKAECAQLMVDDDFDLLPMQIFAQIGDVADRYFCKARKWDAGEPDERYADAGWPVWQTLFLPKRGMHEKLEDLQEEVMDLGFTIVCEEDGSLFALGIDGGGYDFCTAHWIPLYDLLGLHWHDED